jgi:hypothetical protein
MPGANKYDSILVEIDQESSGRAARSVYGAVDVNPDQESGLHKISRRSGIPVEALRLDAGAEAKRRIAVQEVEALPSVAPKTAEFLSYPEKAKISHDDIEGLAAIENIFGRQGGSTLGIASPNDQKNAERAKSIGKSFVEGLSTSTERAFQGMARTGQMAANIVEWSLLAFPDETGVRRQVSEAVKYSADYWKKAADDKLSKQSPGSAENYLQQAGGSIGTSLLAAPFGIGGSGPALGMFGLFADGGYQEMRDAGVSVPIAAGMSASNQVMEGLTEKIGLDRIYKGTGPIIKKAVGFVFGDLAGEELNTVYNALVDKINVKPDMTMGDVAQQVLDTAIVTAIAGPVQGVTMSGAARVSEGLVLEYDRQIEARKQSDFLLALGEGVKASKTFARLPENVKDLVRNIKEGGAVSDVYIPVERIQELYQSQGMDAARVMEQVLSDPSRYHEALATGGDVVIPLEDFAMMSAAPEYAELVKDARLRIGGMSAREAEEFDANREKYVNDLLAEASSVEEGDTQANDDTFRKIYDDAYGQLIGINRSPEQADADATIYAKMVAGIARSAGMTPEEILEQFPVTVTRGPLPDALQKQPSFSDQQYQAQLEAMIDTVRSGKGPKESELFGPSLLDFLREKGLKDQGGELAAMDIDKGQKFKKKLVRQNGLDLDKAREAAAELDYLPVDSTVRDLLDLIDGELRGSPVYAPGNANQTLVDQKLAHDQLSQWLDTMGVDLAQMDNKTIVEMMQKAVDSGEGTQSFDQGILDLKSEAFKKWFGDSKVVDENGEPLVVYHGSTRGGIEKSDSRNTFFTSDNAVARTYSLDDYSGSTGENPVVQEVYLRIENPLVVDAEGGEWMDIKYNGKTHTVESLARDAKKLGHDGLIVKNVTDNVNDEELDPSDVYVTLGKTSQIKSVFNRGTFDHNDPNILNQYPAISPEDAKAAKAIVLEEMMTVNPESGRAAQLEILASQYNDIISGKANYSDFQAPALFQSSIGQLNRDILRQVDVSKLKAEIGFLKARIEKSQKAAGAPNEDSAQTLLENGKLRDQIKLLEGRIERSKELMLNQSAYRDSQGGGKLGTKTDDLVSRYLSILGQTLAAKGYDQAVPLESHVNSPGLDSQGFSDLFKGDASMMEESGLIGSPAFIAMLAKVRGAILDNPEVLDTVVGLVPVDVVNNLFGSKSAAKVLLHNEAVNENSPAFDADLSIANSSQTSDPVLLFVSEIARSATKTPAVSFGAGLESTKNGTTILTGERNSLSQGTPPDDGKRASIQFPNVNDPRFNITLFAKADASSFLHETGHYYFEVISALAGREGAPEQVKKDYQTLLTWLGATDKESLTVDQLETLARGFEAYIFEGKAPSQELRSTFQRFKVWLKAIYAEMKSLRVTLTDDVRDVFDRLLATDEEIEAARKEIQARPMYATAEEAGLSERVFEAYKKLAEDAHAEAKDRLDKAKMKDARRVHAEWWKDARAKMVEEVEAEAKENPVYEVIHALHNGKLFDGTEFPGGEFKLSGKDLKKMYDSSTLGALKKKLGFIYRNEGGMSPEVAAEMFGFSSGDEMIQKMMEAPKFKSFIQSETDRRMKERYPDMTMEETAAAAVLAVHTDEQAKLLREELRAINRKRREVAPLVNAEKKESLNREKQERDYERRWMDAEKALAVAMAEGAKQTEIDELKAKIREEKENARITKLRVEGNIPPVEFFKEAARRHIGSLTVADIKPGLYSRAEAKAGREAYEANGKGQFEKAAAAKSRQILNHYLYREAVEAREESDKIATYMRKLESAKAQQRIGKAGQDYLEQVNAILDKYEFRRVTNRATEARESLLAWMERKEKANGFAPPVPPSVLEDALQINYRSLTVQKLRDVHDATEAIVHLARVEGMLLREQLKMEVAELADEAADSIEHNSKGPKKRKPEKNLPQDVPGKLIANYFASHRKMSSLARQMDGGHDGGIMWNLIIRPLNEAGDKEASMRAAAAKKLNEIFSVYSVIERTAMTRREFIPQINESLSKWGRISVALNMGNEGNRQRLGSMYDGAQVDAIVDGLDARDWEFVQSVWDFINSYWPDIEAKEKRVHGVAPEKVAAMPVSTKFGMFAGGYYPLKYDAEETAKAGAQDAEEIYKQMMGGGFTRAVTRHGHVEARLEAVNRPLTLSIDVVFQHINQIIHDLTHHEALIDVNRLLGTDQIQEAIRDHYGMEAYRVFTDGVRDVAMGDIPAQDAFERFMNYTRVGISTAGLGWNVVTSLMQPIGLTQSMVRIGPQWVGKGLRRWLGTPKSMVDTADWIYSQSDFMRTRAMTMNREINEISNSLTVGVIPHAVRDSFFYLIQATQKMVDIPTWLGQYEKSMADHGIEADAIAEADQAVIDSQANGQIKDLARIQRGGPLKKMFTTFYSFFSTTYNLAAESKAKTDFSNPWEFGRFLTDMTLLYVLPVILTTTLKEAVQRMIGGGDDDDEALVKHLAADGLSYILGGFIGLREFGSMLSGFQGYEGPAGARFYSEAGKLGKQIQQGEIDAALLRSLNGTGGILFHYPSGQIKRTVEGMIEIKEDRGNVLNLFFGKPRK